MKRIIDSLILVVSVAAALYLWRISGPPSDASMIANFRHHKSEFDRLVVMVRKDAGLLRVDVDLTKPDDPTKIGVHPARIQQYRRIMARIGINRGFESYSAGNEISFLYHTRGLSISGSGKSYVWSKTGQFRNSPVVADLDTLWRSGKSRIWAYRKIQGDWYLHLRVD